MRKGVMKVKLKIHHGIENQDFVKVTRFCPLTFHFNRSKEMNTVSKTGTFNCNYLY